MAGRDKRQNGMALWSHLNILDLDAPLVAMVWQEAAAFSMGAQLNWMHRILVFLAVWVVYCTDRLRDVGDARRPAAAGTRRHQFHWKHRFPLRLACQAVGAVAVLLALATLNSPGWTGACFVFGLTALHFLTAHNPGLQKAFPIRKEIQVGFIFAAGTLVQPWSLRQTDNPHVFWVWLCLGLVFSANCLWVSYWEGDMAKGARRGIFIFTWVGTVTTLSMTAIGWQLDMGWKASVSGIVLALSSVLMLLIDGPFRKRQRTWKQSMADAVLFVCPLAIPVARILT